MNTTTRSHTRAPAFGAVAAACSESRKRSVRHRSNAPVCVGRSYQLNVPQISSFQPQVMREVFGTKFMSASFRACCTAPEEEGKRKWKATKELRTLAIESPSKNIKNISIGHMSGTLIHCAPAASGRTLETKITKCVSEEPRAHRRPRNGVLYYASLTPFTHLRSSYLRL